MSLDSFLEKLAEAAKNDEDSTISGKEEVYPGAEAKLDETLRKDPFHNTTGVWEKFKDSQGRLLDRIFDQLKPSSAADKALFAENLGHGAPGSMETMSPMLSDKVASPSLMERVVAVTGRK